MEIDLSSEMQPSSRSRKKLPMHLSNALNYSDQNTLLLFTSFLLSKFEVFVDEVRQHEHDQKCLTIIKFA